MKLEDLGYTKEFETYRANEDLEGFKIGRVASEHKERYIVKTTDSTFEGEIIGSLRFSASERSDFPAVGDWVAISPYDKDKVLIHHVFPRKSIIERQAVGKHGEKQIIATNIDYAFIVQAVDRDFSINRIERYLTICYSANVEPIIILNKVDLIDDNMLSKLTDEVKGRINDVNTIAFSNATNKGLDELRSLIVKGKTYCLLGSSGVGKSTLLNNLLGKEVMKTNTISESTNRGKHITTHREMIILESGGIIIDNPGMREVGMTDSSLGLDITFDDISQLASECKFKDCLHVSETGCAVLEGVENGDIDPDSYQNYLKMLKEKEHFESTLLDRKKKDKDLGKVIKTFKKNKPDKYS